MKMRKEEYIQEVISRIENKRAKQEVEKELSAHIDDRISYYTDAGYDEETANIKAMEHMGSPEKVSEEMEKLHKDRRRWAFIALSAVIVINIIVSIILQISSYGYPWGYMDDEVFFAAFIIILTLIVNGVIFLLAYISHKRDSLLLVLLLGIEVALIIIYVLAHPFNPFCNYIPIEYPSVGLTISAVMLVLSVIACRWRDDEQKGFISVVAPLFGAVPLSVVVVIILITVYMTVPTVMGTAIAEKQNNFAKQSYLDRMPQEVASAKERRLYDISEYNEPGVSLTTEKGDVDRWYVDAEKIKPVKKLCEVPGEFVEIAPYIYWITDCDGIIMRSQPFDEDMASEEYLISKDFDYPDGNTDELKSLSVYGIDITAEFDRDFLKNTLSAVRYWDSMNIREVNAVKTYVLSWTFEDKDFVFLYKAYLLEDSDGNFCFSPWVRSKVGEENVFESFGEVIPVDEATSKRLHEILKDVPSSEKWFSYPETAYESSSYSDDFLSDAKED
ncbi:MAG: hypothetical protein E7515_08215 [Ruminococcaceae bacterium]|nr:hypothetical protein [Oscillospiraceae bacterium]